MRFLRPGPVIQIVVSAALLALLLRRIELGDSVAALGRLRPGTLAAALGLSLVAYWGRSYRWSVLLKRGGAEVGAWTAYRLTLTGIFYGLVTPGRVGELARVLHLDLPRSRTLPSVVWDRLSDVVLLELLAAPAFIVQSVWRGPLMWIYLAMVAATALLIAALLSPPLLRLWRRLVPWGHGFTRAWEEGSRGIMNRRTLATAFWGGLFFYALSMTGALLLLRDLIPEARSELALSLPVIPLLGNLPIAFGGLGLREQVSAILFDQFGAAAALGPAFSLTWFTVVTLLPGLIGLVLTPRRRAGSRRAPAATPDVPPREAG